MRGVPRWVFVVAVLVLVLMLSPLRGLLGVLLAQWRVLVAMGVVALVIWALRSARAARGSAARWVEVELVSVARGGPREPVSLPELTAALRRTSVGKVRESGGVITIFAEDGQATVEAADPARVTAQTLKLRASSRFCAVLAADALAVTLGPLLVRADGVEVEVDGTAPRAQLEREVWTRQMERMQQLERELEDPKQH
ncbi:MAG: hypothetical protein ACYC8T_02775 [Myxococcaceae bacterium]